MQNGRWTIHARYPATGNEEAIEEGKQIAVSRIGDVRVLRDVYDTKTGMSTEFTIYSSKMISASEASAHNDDDWGGDDDDWGGFDNDDNWGDGEDDSSYTSDGVFDEDARREIKRAAREKKRRQRARAGNPTSFSGLLIKLLLIILLSVGVAAASIPFASSGLDGVNLFGTRMVGIAKENALIIIFIVTFGFTFLILSSILLRNTSLKVRKESPPAMGKPSADSVAAPKPAVNAEMAPTDLSTYAQELRDAMRTDLDEAGGPATDAAIISGAAEDKNGVLDVPDSAPTNEPPPGSGDLSPHEEKQKIYIMKFISSALDGSGRDKKALSNFDRFGVSLFLAGACETMAQQSDVSAEAKQKIMSDSLQTVGFKAEQAAGFSQKYEEYLLQDPSYMQMFEAGRNSMNTYFEDESRIGKNMAVAMDEWQKPKSKKDRAGPVTVLFTDIENSTAMTRELGDAGAQLVVRAHNLVVREALTMCNGKEVKHTGDGIMASFTKTSDSLDAAMQMQREAAGYNAQHPDKPLYLKIGINAGEPIAEDDDLFGSTVQLSARIVDQAQKGEILVSETVRGICSGKEYKFKSRGAFPMKGFDVDPVLFEVVWRE